MDFVVRASLGVRSAKGPTFRPWLPYEANRQQGVDLGEVRSISSWSGDTRAFFAYESIGGLTGLSGAARSTDEGESMRPKMTKTSSEREAGARRLP